MLLDIKQHKITDYLMIICTNLTMTSIVQYPYAYNHIDMFGSTLPFTWAVVDNNSTVHYYFMHKKQLNNVWSIYVMLQTDSKPDRFINGPPVYKPVSRFVIQLARF